MPFFICLFVFLIGNFIITKLIISLFLNLLYKTECIKMNYRKEKIPVAMGLIFIPVLSISVICVICLYSRDQLFGLVFFLGILAMGFAGLLDDLLGDRSVTGLKGHYQALFKKRELTTGGFKAIFGGLVALMISIVISKYWLDIFLNTLIIALFTNFINLLDLRPGRALKGFLLSSFLLLLNPIHQIFRLLLFGLIGSSLAYMPYDLKAKSMMGDVGSNILGISLGIACISAGFYTRVVIFVLLLLVHVYTEKYSLTKTIEKNRILKYFDEIGR